MRPRQPDYLREAEQVMMELPIELEVARQIGAKRYERRPERKTYRNGYHERLWETRVGEIALCILKLRKTHIMEKMKNRTYQPISEI